MNEDVERLRTAAQRALDAHRADVRREVEATGAPAEGGAGCWCHELAAAVASIASHVPAVDDFGNQYLERAVPASPSHEDGR